MTKNYVLMLEESLQKKITILQKLQDLSIEQEEILTDPQSEVEAFEENVEAKERLLDELELLDEGFETLYNKVKDEIETNKDAYKSNIEKMQNYIRKITEYSTNLQVIEHRNHEHAMKKFSSVRSKAREMRKSGKAVTSYYKNMSRVNTIDPQFMDSKK